MELLQKIKDLRQSFHNSGFRKTTAPKLLSLLFAIVFWIYVMDQDNPEMIRTLEDIPVQLQQVESLQQNGLVLMGDKDYSVNVKIKGRRSDVIDIDQSDVRISANLSGYPKGLNSVPLEKIIFRQGVIITDLSESEIKVQLDQSIEIPKTVVVKTKGAIPDNFQASSVIVNPEEILVKGPESIVNTVARLEGELNITNAVASLSKEIPIKAVDNDGNDISGVTLGRGYVQASVGIDKVKKVEIVPDLTGKIADGYRLVDVQVYPQEVTVKGAKSDVDLVETLMTESVAIAGLKETVEVEALLKVPDGIDLPLISSNPKIKLVIEKVVTKEFQVNIVDIPVYNLNSEWNTDIGTLEGVIKIQLTDVESVLESIGMEDLNLSIDGSGFKTGINSAEIVLKTDLELEGIRWTPNKVILEVTDKPLEIREKTDDSSGTQDGKPASNLNN